MAGAAEESSLGPVPDDARSGILPPTAAPPPLVAAQTSPHLAPPQLPAAASSSFNQAQGPSAVTAPSSSQIVSTVAIKKEHGTAWAAHGGSAAGTAAAPADPTELTKLFDLLVVCYSGSPFSK